ncbi:dual specificity phosphatase [Terrimicrobium sacchariphilum]|uniref:Dual specificity phosphatase n=1 Tax=Terrimicrobium sacchariphilum TaxID=690879 RepID=A0A146G9V4_TERSA|nr:protein-tyrosine phosphatase family protein [Terrimicrobium sacchariphilum]GAT34435.1 dual specificity phosphatase [Terrimicrobium sacchariphilum]
MATERFPKLTICGVHELDALDLSNFSHVISIWDPVWMERGNHIEKLRARLTPEAKTHFTYMHDISAPTDEQVVPTAEKIAEILEFGREITDSDNLLVHCWAGVSRSTAVAYSLLCSLSQPGEEKKCLTTMRESRPQAMPNELIISLADDLLDRRGAMARACKK